jgi:hypothetical protein
MSVRNSGSSNRRLKGFTLGEISLSHPYKSLGRVPPTFYNYTPLQRNDIEPLRYDDSETGYDYFNSLMVH